MCKCCDLENVERTIVIENLVTEHFVYLENRANTFRLHMTNGMHHTIRKIYYCPFCGRELK